MQPIKLLIDGSHLMNRVYYTPQGDLRNSKAERIGVIHGFLISLSALYKDYSGICQFYIVWDEGRSRFRVNIYPEYKSEKKDPDRREVLSFSRLHLERIFKKLAIPSIIMTGYEADDIIGYLTRVIDGKKIIISEDKDLLQLLTPDGNVTMYRPVCKQFYDYNQLIAKYDLLPDQAIPNYVYLKAIVGDGEVPKLANGLGEKNANRIVKTILTEGFEGLNEGNKYDKMVIDNKDIFWRNVKLTGIMLCVEQNKEELNHLKELLDIIKKAPVDTKGAYQILDELELPKARKSIELLALTTRFNR
jgi:DNA polymerase-1